MNILQHFSNIYVTILIINPYFLFNSKPLKVVFNSVYLLFYIDKSLFLGYNLFNKIN